ncbi:MAG: threonine/serine dehydratase [Tissierellia bacterium]|nr:threonine/serine dehydratase [Tissierellia bacterium]
MLTIDMICQAKDRIAPYIYETPLLRIPVLDDQLGCQVYVKCENMQKTNAFKLRGAINRLLTLSKEDLAKGVITASSGNHGKATAYAAKCLGLKACVVVPNTIPKIKLDGIRGYDAEVIFAIPSERTAVAKSIRDERECTFISPYDDYEIMAGQGTIGLEIMEQLSDVDTLVIPIGGGGLIGGISTSIKEMNPNIRVIGVEPTNTCRYTKSFAAGKRVKLSSDSTSVADGAGTLIPGERNFPIVQKNVDEIVTVDEEYILKGTKLMLNSGKILIETTSGLVIGAVLQSKLKFHSEEKVVFLLSGGNIAMDGFI